MNLSEDQVIALAPDESSKKSGKELANLSKWSNLGNSDKALWGECQGSGKNPYKTQVDLSSIAFKCSCPSRKFPCKHGLGMLLLYARQQEAFKHLEHPEWVKDWIEKREEKAEKKSEKTEKPVDAAAQAKRAQQRQKKVEQGVEELQLVLKDIVRSGILSVPEKAPDLFDNLSKRMIDAQATGLAFMVKELAEINYFTEQWQTAFLDQLAKIQLVSSAFKVQEQLPELLQEEIRALVGFSRNTDELKQQEGTKDTWFVLAKKTTQQEQLHVQKNWLLGMNSGTYALVIQFYVNAQLPDLIFTPGTAIEAELSFYKSTQPYRAIVKEAGKVVPAALEGKGFASWRELLNTEKKYLQASPFVTDQIYFIHNLSLALNQEKWLLVDREETCMPLLVDEKTKLKLLAITGGKSVDLIVSGLEGAYTPMAIRLNHSYFTL